MSLTQTLYFMSLVGGIAGLGSWVIVGFLGVLLRSQPQPWLSDLVAASVLGFFIGSLTVGFSDKWSGNTVMFRWIASGALVGGFGGLISGFIEIPISRSLTADMPFVARLISWMLAGSCIGLCLGLRWVSSNRNRVLYAGIGGLLGGLLGGVIFVALGTFIPDLSQALGFVAVGVGISSGITLAPILFRGGILQFISSGDPRAQSKFGPTKKEWDLGQSGSYLIGSESGLTSLTRFHPGLEVFIPDASIAPRHAVLFAKQGRFYIGRHPETATPSALGRFIVRVRGKSVLQSEELRHLDDILIGKTALRFVARKTGS